MRRDAGFTTFVILIAGLGIGASSTIFSVVNALLLRPLPFRDAGASGLDCKPGVEHSGETTIWICGSGTNHSPIWLGSPVFGVGDSELTGTGEPERLTSAPVTQNFFTLLGVQPAIGRSFTAEECQAEIQQSTGRAVELRLLAEAVCFRPGRGGTEADAEQQASNGGGCAACVLRFRERFCARHSGRCVHSLAPDGGNEPVRKYDEGDRKAEAGRHGAERSG